MKAQDDGVDPMTNFLPFAVVPLEGELPETKVLSQRSGALLGRITDLRSDVLEFERASKVAAELQAAQAARAATEAAEAAQAAAAEAVAEAARRAAQAAASAQARRATRTAFLAAATVTFIAAERTVVPEPEPEPEPKPEPEHEILYPLCANSVDRWRHAGEASYAAVIQRCWRRVLTKRAAIKAALETEDAAWQAKQNQDTAETLVPSWH
jgi:hypothetical protein